MVSDKEASSLLNYLLLQMVSGREASISPQLFSVINGVRQGSILSPQLFSVTNSVRQTAIFFDKVACRNWSWSSAFAS